MICSECYGSGFVIMTWIEVAGGRQVGSHTTIEPCPNGCIGGVCHCCDGICEQPAASEEERDGC